MNIEGHKVPKWALIGGAGVLVAGGIYVWKRAQNSASTSNTANTGIDPVTGLPYSEDQTVDPITGQSYLAEAQEYGSVQAAEVSIQPIHAW
jgi:hypothetical protein